MKNALTILLASFILLSGMHLSIARHFCGGKMVDAGISFSEATLTCGMDKDKSACSVDGNISSDCCRNEFSMLTVDDYLSNSSLQIKEVAQPVFQLFFLPLIQSLHTMELAIQNYPDIGPPDNLIVTAVSLPQICVFRI